MTQSDAGDQHATRRRALSGGFRQLAVPAAATVGGFLLVGAGLPWLKAITPHWMVIRAGIVLLWFVLGAFLLAVPAAAIGTLWSWIGLLRCRRRRDRGGAMRWMKWALLCSSVFVSLIVMEAAVKFMDHGSYRIPDPRLSKGSSSENSGAASSRATREGREGTDPNAQARAAGAAVRDPVARSSAGGRLKILVLGESSAVGEPYEPWISVARIVAWKLEEIVPGRVVEVDVRARGGFCLEQALLPLDVLDYKPDAILLFSGHNEFHARYSWNRNVAHYVEDGPESLLGLEQLARSLCSTTHVIFKTLDRFYGEAPPPPQVSRELVDRPSFTPKEYRYLLDEFERRLEALAEYCNRNGTLAIWIVPGSNDGAYEPGRSSLTPETSPVERSDFATAFREARSREAAEPQAAIAAYRRLIASHPEFAETHYRLGKVLAQTEQWEEAGREFVIARDRDGLPVRCPSDFQAVIRSVARKYGTMLVDAPSILAKVSPHGILDDYLYHDAHHMNLVGTVAVARDVLGQLRANHNFAWPETTPLPRIDLLECARHFKMDSKKWVKVCERSSGFYSRLAYTRYDPADRLLTQERYNQTAAAISAGRQIDFEVPRSMKPLLGVVEQTVAKGDVKRPR